MLSITVAVVSVILVGKDIVGKKNTVYEFLTCVYTLLYIDNNTATKILKSENKKQH